MYVWVRERKRSCILRCANDSSHGRDIKAEQGTTHDGDSRDRQMFAQVMNASEEEH